MDEALHNEISKYLGRAKWDPDYTPGVNGLDLNHKINYFLEF
jgi:hypothetical protein